MMGKKTPFNAYYYNFKEGDAALFAPTFKLIPGTNTVNINYRIPSWTDRILYRSRNLGNVKTELGYRDEGDILTLINYDSNNHINMSDHRPVYAQFILRMDKHIDQERQRRYFHGYGGAEPRDEREPEETKGETRVLFEMDAQSEQPAESDRTAQEDRADIIGMAERAHAKGQSYNDY